jgi:hypothetical protein
VPFRFNPCSPCCSSHGGTITTACCRNRLPDTLCGRFDAPGCTCGLDGLILPFTYSPSGFLFLSPGTWLALMPPEMMCQVNMADNFQLVALRCAGGRPQDFRLDYTSLLATGLGGGQTCTLGAWGYLDGQPGAPDPDTASCNPFNLVFTGIIGSLGTSHSCLCDGVPWTLTFYDAGGTCAGMYEPSPPPAGTNNVITAGIAQTAGTTWVGGLAGADITLVWNGVDQWVGWADHFNPASADTVLVRLVRVGPDTYEAHLQIYDVIGCTVTDGTTVTDSSDPFHVTCAGTVVSPGCPFDGTYTITFFNQS